MDCERCEPLAIIIVESSYYISGFVRANDVAKSATYTATAIKSPLHPQAHLATLLVSSDPWEIPNCSTAVRSTRTLHDPNSYIEYSGLYKSYTKRSPASILFFEKIKMYSVEPKNAKLVR
jgi:hypothetical protein